MLTFPLTYFRSLKCLAVYLPAGMQREKPSVLVMKNADTVNNEVWPRIHTATNEVKPRVWHKGVIIQKSIHSSL